MKLLAVVACILATASAFTLAPALYPLPAPHAAAARTAPVQAAEPGGNPLSALLPKIGNGEKKEGTQLEAVETEEKEEMTLEKIASFGIAGILSIAVAETVFWVLSFPTSEVSSAATSCRRAAALS